MLRIQLNSESIIVIKKLTVTDKLQISNDIFEYQLSYLFWSLESILHKYILTFYYLVVENISKRIFNIQNTKGEILRVDFIRSKIFFYGKKKIYKIKT